MNIILKTFARPDVESLQRLFKYYQNDTKLEFVFDNSYDKLIIFICTDKCFLKDDFDLVSVIDFKTEPSVSFWAKQHTKI